NGANSTGSSYSTGQTNVSWLSGTGSDLIPADLLASFRTAFTDAMAATLGIVSQVTARYNYNVDGSGLAQGAPVGRKYKNEEYEGYVGDTWRLSPPHTLWFGIRHSLMPPIYEADGQQTTAAPSLGEWFHLRNNLGNVGLPQSQAGNTNF